MKNIIIALMARVTVQFDPQQASTTKYNPMQLTLDPIEFNRRWHAEHGNTVDQTKFQREAHKASEEAARQDTILWESEVNFDEQSTSAADKDTTTDRRDQMTQGLRMSKRFPHISLPQPGIAWSAAFALRQVEEALLAIDLAYTCKYIQLNEIQLARDRQRRAIFLQALYEESAAAKTSKKRRNTLADNQSK